MLLETQFRLKSNPNYIKYLRENSYWYKTLTRNPSSIKEFIEEVNIRYKMRRIDKITNTLNMVETIQNILSTLK